MAKELLWFHFCFEIDVHFINHNHISMHLKNILPDMRQVHYLFHVITMPGEHRCLYKVLWPPRICSCMLGAIDPLLLPCITEGETES